MDGQREAMKDVATSGEEVPGDQENIPISLKVSYRTIRNSSAMKHTRSLQIMCVRQVSLGSFKTSS